MTLWENRHLLYLQPGILGSALLQMPLLLEDPLNMQGVVSVLGHRRLSMLMWNTSLSANWKLVFKTSVWSLSFSYFLLSQVSEMKDPGPFSSS